MPTNEFIKLASKWLYSTGGRKSGKLLLEFLAEDGFDMSTLNLSTKPLVNVWCWRV